MNIVPDMLILYVEDVPRSIEFYSMLFNRKPLEASAGFALFALGAGLKLGLWKRPNVEPAARLTGGGAELCVAVSDVGEVDRLEEDWRERGVRIAQAQTQMDFGYTFVGEDPDGHRLRVFLPSERG